MPDYTACLNVHCPMRHGCARYLMKPGPKQSFNSFQPDAQGMDCDHHVNANKAPFRLLAPWEADLKNSHRLEGFQEQGSSRRAQ